MYLLGFRFGSDSPNFTAIQGKLGSVAYTMRYPLRVRTGTFRTFEPLLHSNSDWKMKKDRVLEIMDEMPGEFDLEQLIERLIFIEKVEKGLEQSKAGEVISHDEVKANVLSWRKSSGQ